jgi:hypothetical protein
MSELKRLIIDVAENKVIEKTLTAKEIKEREEEIKQYEIKKQELLDAEQAQKELKISAYKKLGLTDEEIAAIL